MNNRNNNNMNFMTEVGAYTFTATAATAHIAYFNHIMYHIWRWHKK